MNNNLNEYKERVKRLRKAVSSVLNVECTQSQAYELIAKEDNYPNWDALSGCINTPVISTKKDTLTTKEQITQLFLLYEGLKNGCSLFFMIELLKQQKDPTIKNGWSNVKSLGADTVVHEIFEQTNFFYDDVLDILKISSITGNLESAIKSSIEYLKTY